MLENQRHLFNLPSDISYLNCAYMSPLLKSVSEVGTRAIYQKEDPTQIKSSDFFENTKKLRAAFADLIQVDNPDYCAIIPSASYGMAVVAQNLKAGKGDNIVVFEEQFPSNVYAWKQLEQERGIELKIVAEGDMSPGRGERWNQRLLEAIDGNTKMVSIAHVHWADGTLFDLKAIRQRTREVGAILVIDGTQSIGALPFSVKEIEADAVIVAGYKWLLGPYSIGVAYFGEYFQNGRPFENNWMNRLGSEDFSGLVNYQDQFQPGSIRFEVGESANFILSPMLTQAIREVIRMNPANIQEYAGALTRPYLEQIMEMGYQVETEELRAKHLLGIRLPEQFSMEKVKQQLTENHVYVSFRGNAIRVSTHLFNIEKDFEALCDGLTIKSYA